MKKFLLHPITIIAIILVLIVVLTLCGFKVTYNPSLNNNWDAISACAGWASVFVSGMALWYAIQIPKKIAKEQNKISLFEKRYEVFQLFEQCASFEHVLQNTSTIEEMRRACSVLLNGATTGSFEFNHVLSKTQSFEHTLHQMTFLFHGIPEKDIYAVYSSLIDTIVAIVNDTNAREVAKKYIEAMEKFTRQHYEKIWNDLSLANQ